MPFKSKQKVEQTQLLALAAAHIDDLKRELAQEADARIAKTHEKFSYEVATLKSELDSLRGALFQQTAWSEQPALTFEHRPYDQTQDQAEDQADNDPGATMPEALEHTPARHDPSKAARRDPLKAGRVFHELAHKGTMRKHHVINYMIEWHSLFGWLPHSVDWEPYAGNRDPVRIERFERSGGRKHWPTVKNVAVLFGNSFDKAREAAEEKLTRPEKPNNGDRSYGFWTREGLVQRGLEWQRLHGFFPRVSDWDERVIDRMADTEVRNLRHQRLRAPEEGHWPNFSSVYRYWESTQDFHDELARSQ